MKYYIGHVSLEGDIEIGSQDGELIEEDKYNDGFYRLSELSVRIVYGYFTPMRIINTHSTEWCVSPNLHDVIEWACEQVDELVKFYQGEITSLQEEVSNVRKLDHVESSES